MSREKTSWSFEDNTGHQGYKMLMTMLTLPAAGHNYGGNWTSSTGGARTR